MIDATLSHPDFHGTVTAAGGPALPSDDSAPDSPPGFALLAEVGRGGMGVVYRARDLALDREVAVKLLRLGFEPGSAAAIRFAEEARVTGQLQHPGIPAVYQVGTLPDGRPFLAMKLIEGDTLDALLKTADTPDVPRVFDGICQAVGYAHAHGVIHRDLKPHNVMVGAFGEVQVMDWGLAKRIRNADSGKPHDNPTPGDTGIGESDSVLGTGSSDLTQHGSVLGTPAYMPPEQAIGDRARIGPPSDVFGLGAILCVLLTGKPPFAGESVATIREAAARGDTAAALTRLDASGADPDLIALCKRCLAFDPADRPTDAGAVASEVARLRAAADDRARRAEVARAAAGVRRRLIRWATVAVVAVLAAGGAASLWQAAIARREAADAETARARADARLTKAVEAVERMVTRAGTARWARDPSLAAERRQVLADAVAFYEGFGEAGDPVVRRETARAHRRIGSAYLLMGDYPTATTYLRRALAGAEGLAAEFPEQTEYAADLAEIRLNLAATAASSGHAEEALAVYRQAMEAARRAVAGGSPPEEVRRTLVSCLIGTSFFSLQSDPAAGAALIREAVGAVDGLLATPNTPFANRALAAYTYASVATHDFNGGRHADGIANVRRAEAILADTPPDPNAPAQYRDLFDMTAGLLAMTNGSLILAAEPVRAAAFYRQAAEKFDELLAVYPKAFQHRFYKVLILHQEAQVLARLRRTGEERKRRAECLALAEEMRTTSPAMTVLNRVIAVQRPLALADAAQAGQMADFDRRADETLAAAAADLDLPGIRYNVACALALGSRYGTPEQREGRAARAVELLTALLGSNFYRGPTNAIHVAADTDLVPLHRRADYRAFLAALRSKFPPPPEVLPPPRSVKEK